MPPLPILDGTDGSGAKNAKYPYELGKIKWMDEWTDQMTVARNSKDNPM